MEFSLELIGAFLALTVLELVLGIDNIVFITILASRVAKPLRRRARLMGLALAMVMRVALLFSISWLMGLTAVLFSFLGQEISGRDLILGVGGLFLVWKASSEMQKSLEWDGDEVAPGRREYGLMSVLAQIALIDIVFSLDSVITAVGLVEQLPVMVAAIVVAILVMMLAAEAISSFLEQHPSLKILALAFLVLIGVTLVADALDIHVPRGYIYFAMAFSFGVQMLNLWAHKHRQMRLHQSRFRHLVQSRGGAEPDLPS